MISGTDPRCFRSRAWQP